MINDVKNLKESGGASVAELREFLKGLKARNPQEVIGIVSASLLIQSLIISAVLTVGMMALFTIGPYILYGPPQAQAAAARPTKATASANSDAKPATLDASNANTAAQSESSSATKSEAPDVAKAAKAMGLDETKAADPKKNPLDKPDLDKLLDGL